MRRTRKIPVRSASSSVTLPTIILSLLAIQLNIASLQISTLQTPVALAAEVTQSTLPTPREVGPNTDPEALQTYASKVAEMDGLDVKRFLATLQCEGQWNPKALGDRGTSYGIAQFHHLSDWNMTKEEAYDPYYAIQKMAEAWEQGLQSRWSCYALTETNSP